MLNFERTLEQLSGLTLLRFFPGDPDTRLELAKLIGRMCSTEAQVDWLVARVIALCNEWPGPVVLRQILCSKFKPADGIEAGSTAQFPEGPPNELGTMQCLAERQIEAPERLALPAGHVASIDRGLDAMVKLAAYELDMNRPMRRRRIEVPAPTNPDYKPITQADIDRAVEEHRNKRAQQELGETF